MSPIKVEGKKSVGEKKKKEEDARGFLFRKRVEIKCRLERRREKREIQRALMGDGKMGNDSGKMSGGKCKNTGG
jgi:hypothetical protein